ncbi:hypothetical protein ACEQ8H_005631 [Pleosporales sp. CAS-2024a]
MPCPITTTKFNWADDDSDDFDFDAWKATADTSAPKLSDLPPLQVPLSATDSPRGEEEGEEEEATYYTTIFPSSSSNTMNNDDATTTTNLPLDPLPLPLPPSPAFAWEFATPPHHLPAFRAIYKAASPPAYPHLSTAWPPSCPLVRESYTANFKAAARVSPAAKYAVFKPSLLRHGGEYAVGEAVGEEQGEAVVEEQEQEQEQGEEKAMVKHTSESKVQERDPSVDEGYFTDGERRSSSVLRESMGAPTMRCEAKGLLVDDVVVVVVVRLGLQPARAFAWSASGAGARAPREGGMMDEGDWGYGGELEHKGWDNGKGKGWGLGAWAVGAAVLVAGMGVGGVMRFLRRK